MDNENFIIIKASELEMLIKKAVAEAWDRCQISTSIHSHEEDQLIGTKEACKILGCCPRTMQNYRDRKCFRVVMRGSKKALYYRSDILAFRDANQINTK